MAQALPKIDFEPTAPDRAGPRLAPAPGVSFATVPSPARALQERLRADLPPPGRWPVGQRVALIAAASVALWTALLHASVLAAHAVA